MRFAADRLICLSAAIGAIGLATQLVVIVADVILREVHKPIYGGNEIVTMSMVVVVFGAMAICDRSGGHISVDLLERFMPSWLNRTVDVLSALLGAAIFLTLAWALYDLVQLTVMLRQDSTNLLALPKDWFQWSMVGFAILTALGMLLRAVELAFAGRDVRTEKESAA